jgi:hypothetical protein
LIRKKLREDEMVVARRILGVAFGTLRNRVEPSQPKPSRLLAQAKEPKQKKHKSPALENGSKKKDPASEPGNQHGKSGTRMPSVFRITPREVIAESKKKGGWGGSNPYK